MPSRALAVNTPSSHQLVNRRWLNCFTATNKKLNYHSYLATAYYRLLPQVQLLREVKGEEAVRLQKCFSPGVIDLVSEAGEQVVAKVNDARQDLCSRNVYKECLGDAVQLTKIRDHFICKLKFYKGVNYLGLMEFFLFDCSLHRICCWAWAGPSLQRIDQTNAQEMSQVPWRVGEGSLSSKGFIFLRMLSTRFSAYLSKL